MKIFHFQTIEKLPDKVLLNIFSYLSHLEICRMGERKIIDHFLQFREKFVTNKKIFFQQQSAVVGDK